MPQPPSRSPSWMAALEHVAAGVAVLRAVDGELVFANPALRALVACEPRAAFTDPGRARVFLTREGAPYPADRLPFVRAARTGRRESAEDAALRRPEGHWQPVRVEAAPLLDARGEPEFIVVTITVAPIPRDDELGSAVRSLTALADEQRFLLENMSDLVYSHDRRGYFHYVSPTVERLTGYTVEEWCRHYTTYLTDHPMNERVVRMTEEALATGRQMPPYRAEIRSKDGRRILLEINERPFFRDGEVAGIIGVARDVTDRVRAEAAAIALSRRLADQNRDLERFVHVASHDLRSPLVSIEGFATELEDAVAELAARLGDGPEADGRVRHLVEGELPSLAARIARGARRMAGLLDGLLRISRLARAPLEQVAVDVEAQVRQVLEGIEPRLGADTTVRIGPLPSCRGDAAHVQQVFANLIDNALKYRHPDRPCRIDIGGERLDDRVVYRVTDNGIGMSAAEQARIFEPFYRLQPGRAPGEGLGLAIVQRIVERLGGSIRVESTPGEGSTFSVELPASDEDARPAVKAG